MSIFLALVTAAVFGVGDFFGGMAAKRVRVLQVIAGSHFVGAVGSTLLALVIADRFDLGDLGLGAAGGLFGVMGVALLYRRLSVGPMSVVAPLTAITSAIVPTAWGLIDGERLSGPSWLGIAFGLLAVLLVSIVPDRHSAPLDQRPEVTPQVVAESLLAGFGFGSMFIFLDATDAASAPWPVAGARILTTSLLVILLVAARLRHRRPIVPADHSTWGLIAWVGLLDTGSNATFLYAANAGQLAVVSVLSSLYPISTVVLARFVLGERMSRLQGVGFVAAMVATGLLAAG